METEDAVQAILERLADLVEHTESLTYPAVRVEKWSTWRGGDEFCWKVVKSAGKYTAVNARMLSTLLITG